MKISIESIDLGQFRVLSGLVADIPAYLITPNDIKVKFNQENKYLRSTVIDEKGVIIWAAFPKFTNYGENQDNFPVPKSLEGCNIISKLDGSLLSWTKINGKILARTRGTFDGRKLKNGHEIDLFIKKYDKMVNHNPSDTWDYSIITEWVSPLNVIVLRYTNEPKLFLTGKVYHSDYRLETQSELDKLAVRFEMSRPDRYYFNSLDDLIKTSKELKNLEGFVLYSSGDQVLHKLKSEDYLIKHRLKSELSSLDRVLDLYFAWEMPSHEQFTILFLQNFDYELLNSCRHFIQNIMEAKDEVNSFVSYLSGFVEKSKELDQKSFAFLAIKEYTDCSWVAFQMRKGVFNVEGIKKLYRHFLGLK